MVFTTNDECIILLFHLKSIFIVPMRIDFEDKTLVRKSTLFKHRRQYYSLRNTNRRAK